MRTVVCDLDGTLFDCSHRVDYARAGQWDEFHSRCELDKPFEDVLNLLQLLDGNYNVLIVTGRNARYREHTLRQLDRHGVAADRLLMRPDDDYTSDALMKLALLEKEFGSKEAVLQNVAFCLEDRDKVVEAFRNYGLNCWQVRMGDW